MTQQRNLKRRVRERMERTGERHVVAREHVVAKAAEPGRELTPTERATGHPPEEWFQRIDRDGGANMSHRDIARHLADAYGVSGWWAQNITVAYEQARGRRVVNQRPDGFEVSVTKTLPIGVEQAYAAVESALGDWELAVRTATAPRSIRADAPEGRTHIVFDAKGPQKSSVAVVHSKLPDADAVERWRARWRERLPALAPAE